MMKVGVTGGIGSGKSTVCRLFARLGVAVYDSDAGAKRLMTEDAALRRRITDRFGAESLCGRELEPYLPCRAGLLRGAGPGRPERHGAPGRPGAISRRGPNSRRASYVILESALLFDAGFDACVDRTVAVLAPEALRIERTCRRDGRTAGEVRRRIAAQTRRRCVERDGRLHPCQHPRGSDLEPAVAELHRIFSHEAHEH